MIYDEVIGLDNGYGFTKTVNTEFRTSIRDYGETKPSLMEKVVEYKGKYYIIGGDRKKVKMDKTDDIDTYILTLAGIGEELKVRGKTESNIVLSVGLPLDRCTGETRTDFAEYFKKEPIVEFKYEDVAYKIKIVDVLVNAQCVAGIVDLLAKGTLPNPSIVIDLGSWTMDILPIEDGKPQAAKAISLNAGVIQCMLKCNEEIRRRTGQEVQEFQIQKIMLGDTEALPVKYSVIVQDVIKKYVKNIADTLVEHNFNIETLPCVFMGGGSSVVKHYGMDLFPLTKYITNIRANAIGYERIAKQQLKMQSNREEE